LLRESNRPRVTSTLTDRGGFGPLRCLASGLFRVVVILSALGTALDARTSQIRATLVCTDWRIRQ